MKDTRKRRVLILENAIDVTGGLKSVLNSSTRLQDDFEFTIALPVRSRCFSFVQAYHIRAIEFPFYELSKNILSWIFYFPVLLRNTIKLKRLVTQLKIDLIIANDFYNLLPCSLRLVGGTVPFVCFVRFLPDRFPKILVKFWTFLNAKYSARIIAVSEAVKKQIRSGREVEVVYDGVVNSVDTSPEADEPITLSPTILYLSNLIEGKGQQYALESFKPLAKKYPEWRLRFVGGDMGLKKNKAYAAYLVNRAAELNIREQVEWKPFQENVQKEYCAASIVLNFSDSESFSLTCLEAMTAGRPVIATNSGGPDEIIDTMQNGILVPVGDVTAMTGAMDLLIANPEMREKIGKAARDHVLSKFASRNTCDQLRAIYLNSMNSK